MKSDGVQDRTHVRSGGGGKLCFGFHEGARSEILAQYLFSAFGAVSRVLQHEDYGIDLYCSLAEKVSSAWLVRDVYFVQVKSESVASWLLSGDSVLWISRHPVPVFLASVDKDQQTIEVYHTLPRFVGAISKLQTLELIPEPQLTRGGPTDWSAGGRQSLSAPILKVKLEDLREQALREKLGYVLKRWVEEDSFNCLMQRAGINRVCVFQPKRTPVPANVNGEGPRLWCDARVLVVVTTMTDESESGVAVRGRLITLPDW